MNEILAGIVLVGGLLLGWSVARRLGFFSPASIYIWFTTVDLGIFLVIAYQHLDKADFTFTAMPWPPFDDVILPVVLIYGLLVSVGWVSVLGLKKPEAATANRVLERLLSSLPKMRKDFTYLIAAFLLLVLWLEVIHFWDIDKGLFWRNDVYLILNDPNSAGIQTLVGRWAHFLLRPLGLVLVGAGAFFWARHRRKTAVLFFLVSIYPLLLAIAQNSRWAPLYIIGGLVVIAFFGDIRRNLLFMVSGGALGLVLFVKVLIGRNTPYQGLGGTIDVFRVIFADLQFQRWGIGFFLNIFEGAQSLANSLLLQPRFPTIYSLLSFSPTVSAIDHFDRIFPSYVVMIAPVVPMNSYGEALFFGLPYFILLLIIVLVWLRVMTQVFLRRDAIGMAFAVFSYWTIFYLSQYPVRNSMRLVYISLLIGILVDRLLSVRRNDHEQPSTDLPVPGQQGEAEA